MDHVKQTSQTDKGEEVMSDVTKPHEEKSASVETDLHVPPVLAPGSVV